MNGRRENLKVGSYHYNKCTGRAKAKKEESPIQDNNPSNGYGSKVV